VTKWAAEVLARDAPLAHCGGHPLAIQNHKELTAMSKKPQDTFYIKASVLLGSQPMATTSYYTDAACTQQVHSPLTSSHSTGVCVFVQAASSELVLMGAAFKTMGHPPVMTANNFEPAKVAGVDPTLVQVSIPMPVSKDPSQSITKGVVLLFSDPGKVTSIYPSSDPQIANSGTP
jgi:hypothetical protein